MDIPKNKESNHYKNYVGYEHTSSKKMHFANKRINQLLDACKYYTKKRDISIYNLSSNSIFEQFKKISFYDYINKIK